MGDGFQFLDIVFFAMVAAFLVLRLRNVLGRRTGQERPPPTDPFARRKPIERPADTGKVLELPDRGAAPAREEALAGTADPISAAVTQIRIADSSFDLDQFLTGARRAFEMVVQAYAAGDTATLRTLLSDDVYENFASDIKARADKSEKHETTLIGIKSAEAIEARVENHIAQITVKFVSEQVNVTRDKEGRIIDGDPNHVATVTDIWTFARNLRARDPNWLLVETRSPH
jgi:predicted lipid-binding transport protein (Tim44 family)